MSERMWLSNIFTQFGVLSRNVNHSVQYIYKLHTYIVYT